MLTDFREKCQIYSNFIVMTAKSVFSSLHDILWVKRRIRVIRSYFPSRSLKNVTCVLFFCDSVISDDVWDVTCSLAWFSILLLKNSSSQILNRSEKNEHRGSSLKWWDLLGWCITDRYARASWLMLARISLWFLLSCREEKTDACFSSSRAESESQSRWPLVFKTPFQRSGS